jgi:hypothetical protein
MRLYILLFGALAGLLGVFGSLAAIGLQLQHQLTGTGEAAFGPWLVTLALSAVGLYGARHALGRPRLSSTVMASAAVGGVLSVAWFFALPAVIFSIASTLGFLWRNEATFRPTDA